VPESYYYGPRTTLTTG
nr:immunoglobulin heavy chain junction region [Mus musculus]